MSKLFKKSEQTVNQYAEFWNWFQKNQTDFFNVVKNQDDIEANFLDKLSPRLKEIKDGFYFLTGMYDENTAELILTADGNLKNIAFIEELVNAAPKFDNWRITALKPAHNIENVSIKMGELEFNSDNLFFYSNDYEDYPDEIDVTIVHNDMTEENKETAINGTYIFLDNYLGELDFVKTIDHMQIVGKNEAEKDLVPISKLKDFLIWRQKEFIEKYDGARYNTENDEFSMLEAQLNSGNMLLAVVNANLLNWERKASHPWIGTITFRFDGNDNNGMPNSADYDYLNKIEDEILLELKDSDGYLNIGRQTAENERDIFFACKDFRKPSKVFCEFTQKYSNHFEIEYDIYKDKYWQSFERFRP